MSKHGKVSIGYQDDYLPFCSEDEKTDEVTGALRDYLDLLKNSLKNADIQFETHPYMTTREALVAMQKGEVDCVFPVNLDAFDSEQMGGVYHPLHAYRDLCHTEKDGSSGACGG